AWAGKHQHRRPWDTQVLFKRTRSCKLAPGGAVVRSNGTSAVPSVFNRGNRMRTFVRLSLLAVPLCTPAIGIAEEWLELRIGNAQVRAEYAVSASQCHQGLMERTELATDQGMLFRFDEV